MNMILFFFQIALAADPKIDYHVLETKNFEIVYDARQKQQAKDYAVQAEKSFEILEPYFGVSPRKTVIVLDDTTDATNGSALSVPRPTIYAFPVLPSPLSTIDHYSVWSKELVLHEYAHILNMEPAKGVWTPFRFLFGSIIRPNMLLPRWYLEGLAVELESRFTSHGRLKSSDYTAMIRSEVLDATWGSEDISRINEVTIPTWPRGQRPYYYGALLWHEIAQQKGNEIFQQWNDRYGARIPYFIEGPPKDDFGKNFQGILNDVYAKYGATAKEEIDEISKAQVVTKGKKIAISSEIISHNPIISPDQTKLAFVSVLNTGDSSIYLINRGETGNFDTKPIPLVTGSDISRVAWFPDSQKIIFDKTDSFERYNTFYDLYTLDIRTKKSERLTFGERAFNASISLDGKKICYLRSHAGHTRLFLMDVNGENKKELYNPGYQVRISYPSFLNSKELIFSQRDLGGKEYLRTLHMENMDINKVLTQWEGSQFPLITPLGIVFTNNKSGVDNLYLADLKLSNAKALTNSQTKILNGTLDPQNNKMYYSQLHSQGYSLEINDIPDISIQPPEIKRALAESFSPEKNTNLNSVKFKTSDYSPLSYMFPQYWLPSIFILPEGFLAGASITSNDPLNLHLLNLTGEFDSRSKKPSGLGSYSINTSLGMLSFSGFYLNSYSSVFDTTSIESGGSFIYSNYILGLSDDWQGLLGWKYSLIDNPLLSDNHLFQGPTVGLSYDDTSQKGYQISPTGKKFQAQYTYYLPNPTKTHHDVISFSGTYLHSKWLPENNVLKLKTQAYYTKTNRSARLGALTVDAPPIIQVGETSFVMRGYPIGEFIAWQAYQGTAEYRFPISYPYKGSGTFPLFLKKIHANIFADFLNMNGLYFTPEDNIIRDRNKKFFPSYGTEITFDTTAFYHVPLFFKFGFAYGADKTANGSPTIYTMIGL